MALDQIGWDPELTSTGLPFIERKATKEARLADNIISRDDPVRLLVGAAGVQGNACPRFSDLYSGVGAHQCTGKAASRKIWKSALEKLRTIDRCLYVSAFSFVAATPCSASSRALKLQFTSDIEKRLLSVVGTIKGPEGSAIDLDAELISFIRDSFDVFELQLAHEEALGTEIDNKRFIEAKTIRDLLELVSG